MKSLTLIGIFVLACAGSAHAQSHKPHWEPFLDTLEVNTIRWFLETTPAQNGLTPDRWPTPSPSSLAAAGFGLSVYPIAAERHVITRAEAARRTVLALRFLKSLRQGEKPDIGGYKGFFFHFLSMKDGSRYWNSELSTIDTGILLMGALFCESYFDKNTATEREIRSLADELYRRVDWQWAMTDTTGIRMGWTPEEGFHHMTWHGMNEALFLYVIALGSPTHPAPPSAYQHWTSTYEWATLYGESYMQFPALFAYQYSGCWIDFRGIKDAYVASKGIDYAEVSRRATYAQWKWVKENAQGWRAYSETMWGQTACDGPKDTTFVVDGKLRRFMSYSARGVSTLYTIDDGTLTPTAPAGSLPYAPEICVPALKAMRATYGNRLFTRYGFLDAFNPSYVTPSTPDGWFDVDYVGIDQGPIVMMIENYRSELVWKTMKKNPYIVQGLKRAGFTGGWLEKK